MDKDTQLWQEYEFLHNEVLGADSLNFQVMGIIVGAVAALLTAGFKETDPTSRLFVFLCVYVVTIPGYRLLQGNRRRIWRISTYIRVFLEPQLEFIKWRTRLDRQRRQAKGENAKQGLSSLVGTNEWFIISMMNILAAIAAVFGGLLQIGISDLIRVGGAVIITAFNLWLLYSTSHQEKDLRRMGRIESDYYKSWTDIRDEEQKK